MTDRARNAHHETLGRFTIPMDVIEHIHAPAKGHVQDQRIVHGDVHGHDDIPSFYRDVTIDLESGTASVTLTEHRPEGVIKASIGSGIAEPDITISPPVGKAAPAPLTGRLADATGNRAQLVHALFRAVDQLPDPVIRDLTRPLGSIGRITAEVRNAIIALARDLPAPGTPDPQGHGDVPAALAFPARPMQRITTSRQREERDALLKASEKRGTIAFEKIMSAEDMLTPGAMAERLNTTRQTIDAWRKSRRLLALKGAKRGYRYPAWQIDERNRLLPGLKEVLTAIGDEVTVFLWLRAPQPGFGTDTGADALRRNPAEDIIEAIRRSGSSF